MLDALMLSRDADGGSGGRLGAVDYSTVRGRIVVDANRTGEA